MTSHLTKKKCKNSLDKRSLINYGFIREEVKHNIISRVSEAKYKENQPATSWIYIYIQVENK
eukprot:c30865_g1_i1 orf=44-229(+)